MDGNEVALPRRGRTLRRGCSCLGDVVLLPVLIFWAATHGLLVQLPLPLVGGVALCCAVVFALVWFEHCFMWRDRKLDCVLMAATATAFTLTGLLLVLLLALSSS